MGKTYFFMTRLISGIFYLFAALLITCVVFGCAKKRPQLIVSQYWFNYENDHYRVRSIMFEEKGEKYNELIGDDFVATDYDQDGFMDYISIGEASVGQAQKVYAYGLYKLRQDDKLTIKSPNSNKYQQEHGKVIWEIISFRSANIQPFNQFKMIDKRQVVGPQITIFADRDADGNLDDVLQGDAPIEQAQSQYMQLIEAGLQEDKLASVDNMILVKKK